MNRSILETLKLTFETPNEHNIKTSIKKEYIVDGGIPKALGNSFVDQIRNNNDILRNKITY
ncbi:hypothetical protein lbkm_2619 [Lachnospiraceae bacterium KM106-2]|nr:hypothetical protein lbkm_2619 [Lachnospiraceae bacterium KM106-2]